MAGFYCIFFYLKQFLDIIRTHQGQCVSGARALFILAEEILKRQNSVIIRKKVSSRGLLEGVGTVQDTLGLLRLSFKSSADMLMNFCDWRQETALRK